MTATLRLAASLADRHPTDAAHLLEGIAADEVAELLADIPADTARRVLEEMTVDAAVSCVALLPPERTLELFDGLPARRATGILRALPGEARDAIFASWPEQQVMQYRKWAGHPAGTAGAMMDPQVTTLKRGMTVDDAIRKLRKAGKSLVYLYVTDGDGRLAGVLNMRSLLLAEPQQLIDELPMPEVASIPADADREEVADLIRERKLLALPVVDTDGTLLGVIRHEEALAAVEQEAFSDLQKMVGAGGDERAMSPVGTKVRKRLPWLVVNLGTAFLAAFVVGLFEQTIATVTALAVLLPVVAGQGGNTGAQSMAVVMRGLALRELHAGSTRSLLIRETLGALINGVAVALICGLAVLAWDGRLALAAVIFLAMILNMVAAGISGASVPLILRRLGFDPAQAASIVLTTITDVVGFAAFLGCAVLFMPLLK